HGLLGEVRLVGHGRPFLAGVGGEARRKIVCVVGSCAHQAITSAHNPARSRPEMRSPPPARFATIDGMTEQQREMLLRRFRAHRPTVAPDPTERLDALEASEELDAEAEVAA
ncbi:MAG: hypothetical protein JWN67_4025, partial [Actinomycetia bacterium]|nr:hypothetical protein [Actinomycetes bacterium]